MSSSATAYGHITLNQFNQPVSEEANITVIELVLDKIAYGWSSEELQYQHPCLSLGQIYSALAYYADHQEELDHEIKIQLQHVDQARLSSRPSLLLNRLKSKNLL